MVIKSPKSFNQRTGRRRLTPEEYEKVLPAWKKGWERYSYLNKGEINWVLKEGISPFRWPGTALIIGKSRAIKNKMLKLRDDVDYRNMMEDSYNIDITKGNLLRVAVKLAEKEASQWAASHDMEENNIFKYEYYLTDKERMSTRRRYREESRWN